MYRLFCIQFSALLRKNWIALAKRPLVAVIRCLILPIAYGVFLAYAQVLLHRLNNYGIGQPTPIPSLASQFDGTTTLLWADATHSASNPSPADIMERLTANFTATQRAAVIKLDNTSEIPKQCPLNFNGFSQCFAGLSFTNIPPIGESTTPVNYTIFADAGLNFIDVDKHTSDFERRIFPLQWSVDQAIIELQTGVLQDTPLEWPYTNITNTEQKTNIRLSYVRGIRNLIALALFINFIGVGYQIPGVVASDRAMLLTEYMKAMGLLDSARILSTHVSISLTYLPSWIAISLIWKYLIFVETNAGLITAIHLLLGLVLASWSFIIAVPFSTSPQLAAVVTIFFAIVLAILGLILGTPETGPLFVFSVIFPPTFYIFVIKAICGYENHRMPTNILHGDPDRGIIVLPLLIAAIVDIILWPILAVLLERCIYSTRGPQPACMWKSKRVVNFDIPSPLQNVVISIRNLTKSYRKPFVSFKKDVTVLKKLDLDIPKTGIFVILGSNGAGKSTLLSIISGLIKSTSGMIIYEDGYRRPSRGTLGLVPQKNVLFPYLTCLQTLQVWKAVKWSPNSDMHEDMEMLLRDCDLGHKIHASAGKLSGGQKRKLQLAIGLLGGSQIILVDECTSGVDPLSRRALWKILSAFRHTRSIVFTTHFLDEADLLADQIVVLASPGKVVASGSPVALKHDLGEGYFMQVLFSGATNHEKVESHPAHEILVDIQKIVPQAYVSVPSHSHVCYHLKTRDNDVIIKVLGILDQHMRSGVIVAYDILGTTIEDIFLEVMNKNDTEKTTLSTTTVSPEVLGNAITNLPSGRHVPPLRQAWTIFCKRLLIARRSWLSPLLAIAVAVAGSCIPLIFIKGKDQVCSQIVGDLAATPLYLPSSSLINQAGTSSAILASPPGIVSTLGPDTESLRVRNVPDNSTFMNTINYDYHNISIGGISLDEQNGSSLIAWDATPPGIRGSAMLNLATNILYNRALNVSGNASPTSATIQSYYVTFPRVAAATLVYLRWMFFFGTFMAVYPAFYALYVSKERSSSVQVMQFSNGLSNPIGLWLGHLMFDAISAILLSTIIIVIFATVTDQFYGLGFLWLVLVLYGIASALFAYCLSLMASSPLAAFALVAGYQFITFVLYLSSYLFILTFGTVADSNRLIIITHFSVSVVAPVASVARAALVAANLFTLACDGQHIASTADLVSITRYGGPILYLVIYAFVLFGILLWVDSGPRKLGLLHRKHPKTTPKELTDHRWSSSGEVCSERGDSSKDPLRVIDVSKSFNNEQVTENVDLSIPTDTIFALLGPNGAGKTTMFNIIRGEITPDSGDVYINGSSIIRHPRPARSALGVCPQFTAIDPQLTVREHLMIYGQLKGLKRGHELQHSIEVIVEGTSLSLYVDRLASKLSGGNQRKLALAIALLGNPPVLLIDEFSTGVDPGMKRGMWDILRKAAIGKAIVITTHSMEEASAIANQVGIISKKMLATGTVDSLSERYATYEVHFTCRTREDVLQARSVMALIPGSRIIEDVATRFEVPIAQSTDGSNHSLAQLFRTLSSRGTCLEYTIERPSLESVFLKVIQENNREEEHASETKRSRWWHPLL